MSWQRIRGHDRLVQAFDRVVSRGRLAHAYLFTGPPGVGKRLFAGELAKALLCETPPASRLEACDQCPSCLQVEAGTHPDFFSASRPEDSLEVPIDLMRELLQTFALKSARGRGKVVILDDADDLNEESANCFLKTLEEPPPRSVLLLIGTSPERQLPTILSRCQVIRFMPLPETLVADLLRDQGIEDPAFRERLARLGRGSPGEARSLADPALWDFRRRLLEGLLKSHPDTVNLAKEWTQFVEEGGKTGAPQRRRAALVLRLLVEFISDAICLSVGAAPLSGEEEDLALLKILVARTNPDLLLELLERCLEGGIQIDRYTQLVLVLEGLMDAFGQKITTARP